MTRIPYDPHLTGGDDKLARQVQNTHAGMAHFAGTGPRGKTCRECIHWAFDGYLASNAQLKQTICEKFTALMNGRVGSRFPHTASACKHFEANPMPPTVYDPRVR